jgi:hypothetical protein
MSILYCNVALHRSLLSNISVAEAGFGLDVLAGQYEFMIFKRTVSYITLPMSALEHRQLFTVTSEIGFRPEHSENFNSATPPMPLY